jgi:putative ABC transport system substrate-binding protein
MRIPTAYPYLIMLASLLLTTFAQAAPPDGQRERTVAIIYAEGDEESAEFAKIISGIQVDANIVLLRLAAAGTGSSRLFHPDALRVAMAEHPGQIAVLFPDLGEPYKSVFAKIIEGVEAEAGGKVSSVPVGINVDARDIAALLKRHDIKLVIALGRQGLKAAAGLGRGFPVVGGGLVSVSEADVRNISVLSLAPDPALLFERLIRFQPSVRRIFTVYDPRQNSWLMKFARDAARTQGLELIASEAPDLKSAVQAYQELLPQLDPRQDALWLPQDSTTVEETTVLPMVLEGAWTRGITLFSSSVAHVRRGALFSLYPNNVALGRQLVSSAQNLSADGTSGGVTPLREVLAAVNVRTASHLGLAAATRQQSFDLVFPEP